MFNSTADVPYLYTNSNGNDIEYTNSDEISSIIYSLKYDKAICPDGNINPIF